MSWLIPENKLDSSKRHPIDDLNIHSNDVCLKGFTKTGKTLCLIHLIRKILLCKPNLSILFIVSRNIEVEKYRIAFKELNIKVQICTYHKYLSNLQKCDFIFCDDIQNISVSTLSAIANSANRIIVAMNPYMPIFEKDLLSQEPTVTIDDVLEMLSPRVYELQYLHKRPINIDLIKNLISETGLNNSNQILSRIGTLPKICKADNEDSEIDYIISEAKRAIAYGNDVGILLPTNKAIMDFVQRVIKKEGGKTWEIKVDKWGKIDFSQLNQHLSKEGISLNCLGTETYHYTEMPKAIRVINYYNSMVYEFDTVFIPFLNSNLLIHSNDIIARNLFLYSILSSNYCLYMSYSGNKHHYLSKIEMFCSKINISEVVHDNNNFFIGI
jgi:hypothetical protein